MSSFRFFLPIITPEISASTKGIAFLLYWPALGIFLLTFPTGRFAPRWTWLVILLWIIQIPLYTLLMNGPPLLLAAEGLLVWGSSFAVLAWRYRHLYTYAQRQQTKWLLYGFVPFYLLFLLYGALQSISALNNPDSLYLVIGPILLLLVHLTVPLAVGIALLRYQLWDIDLLIDRRFYRRKYDAAKVVAAFSDTLRQEVDLDRLREHLLAVVQETMQPAYVSLWLRQPTREASPSLQTSKAATEEARVLEQSARHGM